MPPLPRSCRTEHAGILTRPRARITTRISSIAFSGLREYKNQFTSLEPLFAAAGSSLTKAELVHTLDEVAAARVRLRDVRRVALELLHDSEVLRCCTVLEGGWESNSLDDAQSFLGIEAEGRPGGEMIAPLRLRSRGGRQHRLRPLPQRLVAALHWLLAVCSSRLFHRFWADAAAGARAEEETDGEIPVAEKAEEPLMPPLPTREVSSISHEEAALEEEEWFCRALAAVRTAWANAYSGLVTHDARLDELREYVQLLLHDRELQILEATASGNLAQSLDVAGGAQDGALESVDAWSVLSPNPEWQSGIAAELAQLAHLCNVRAVLPRVRGCLSLFEVPIECYSSLQPSSALLASHRSQRTVCTTRPKKLTRVTCRLVLLPSRCGSSPARTNRSA